jgi:O-phosphoseryl-tRNA(Cys) synthetase
VDHTTKTISCDLYELLAGSNEDDGKAFELANTSVLSENQILKVIDESFQESRDKIERKMQINMQQWERRRRDTIGSSQDLAAIFKDVLVSEKVIGIDVIYRRDEHIRHTHLLQTF